ncbi:hypothetical protein WA158_005439 [Blastocystis sp. Blastoise]
MFVLLVVVAFILSLVNLVTIELFNFGEKEQIQLKNLLTKRKFIYDSIDINTENRQKFTEEDYYSTKKIYINDLNKLIKCNVNLDSPICNSLLSIEEQHNINLYYDSSNTYKNRYTAVLGTTLVITEQNSRNFIQNYFLDSLVIFHKYTNIRFVVFTDSQLAIDEYTTNKYNVPILKSIINTLETKYESWFYGYLNGDILLNLNIENIMLKVLESIYRKEIKSEVVLVSTRSNIQDSFFFNKTFTNNYEYNNILNETYKISYYANPIAIDVFIATKYTLTNHLFDDIVIGRFYIDGYVIDNANFRYKYVDTIDITPSTFVIHIFGSEKYKKIQTDQNMRYNGKYFTSKTRAGLCDISTSNLKVNL